MYIKFSGLLDKEVMQCAEVREVKCGKWCGYVIN